MRQAREPDTLGSQQVAAVHRVQVASVNGGNRYFSKAWAPGVPAGAGRNG